MARRLSIRSFVYYAFSVTEWAAGIMLALLTLIASQDAKEYSLWPLPNLILWSQDHKLLIFALAIIAVVAKFARERVGPPWAWKAIKDVVDIWQGKINARTLCGTKIEKNGSNWGVIIIDSRSTNLTVSDDQVGFAAAALGKFIERA